MQVVIEFEWKEVGTVGLSLSGKLAFPSLLPEPGIYRFRLSSVSRTEVYIGESENLRQRMEHYYRHHGHHECTGQSLAHRAFAGGKEHSTRDRSQLIC